MGTRRADKIAEALEQLIFSGVYENGERLDEHKLAEHFRVSHVDPQGAAVAQKAKVLSQGAVEVSEPSGSIAG